MQITRSSIETTPGPSEWFTGSVYIDAVAAPSGDSRVSASSVHFTPGARTAWHTHPNGQTIYVLEGIGLAQRRGGPIELIRPGDRVFLRAGRRPLARRHSEPLHDAPRDPRRGRGRRSRDVGRPRHGRGVRGRSVFIASQNPVPRQETCARGEEPGLSDQSESGVSVACWVGRPTLLASFRDPPPGV
jgi:quercetin dioxygenase-like cupin family protein